LPEPFVSFRDTFIIIKAKPNGSTPKTI
jgi:hypothetical protein